MGVYEEADRVFVAIRPIYTEGAICMMNRPIKPILMLGMILIFAVSACKSTGIGPTNAAPTPTIAITVQSFILATPYAQEPAAGICASFAGDIVRVTLNADVPDPRCSKVRAEQKLSVINGTQNTLEVSIGSFTASLKPGAETLFDTPFGEYLAPGVHQLRVSPCCGPEIWLEGSK
jgi:hypothetical protein